MKSTACPFSPSSLNLKNEYMSFRACNNFTTCPTFGVMRGNKNIFKTLLSDTSFPDIDTKIIIATKDV